MTCRTIVFSHANSFPASTYRSLFKVWREAGYEVHALDKFGHDPRYPVTPDWPFLVEQLREFIERQVGHPAILIGHSLGGYLSTMVACRHPHLAKGLILLDSPIVAGWRAASLGLLKSVGGLDRVLPSGVSSQRCHQWPDLEAARQHFTAKPKFAAFSPSVLADYVHQGTTPEDNGPVRRLSFDRDIETAIYRAMPHKLAAELRRHPVTCPTAFIGGTASHEVRSIGMDATKRLVGDRISWIQGSHLYPLEHPDLTAREVLQWLTRFEA
ncbi:MAG: alpha/beta hydrolase [Burkholderiales bacterium]|nr:alpha/beta hydrolase [Burkholderiales bacterium]